MQKARKRGNVAYYKPFSGHSSDHLFEVCVFCDPWETFQYIAYRYM